MRKATLGVVLSIFLIGGVLEILRIVWDAKEEMELDYGEGIVLAQASEVFDLKTAFHPIEQYPHIVFHYTPVYHMVVNSLSRLSGNVLLTGRLVSMVAAFWIVGILGWTVFSATNGYGSPAYRWSGVAITCAFALQLPSMRWAPLARVDLLGLAVEFTALSLITLKRFKPTPQLAACFLLLLGLYTKQSLIAIPAASILLVGIILPVRGLWLSGVLIAAGVSVFLVFMWLTDGGVLRHWFYYNINPFHLGTAIFYELALSANLSLPIAAGLATLWLVAPQAKGTQGDTVSLWKMVSARLIHSRLRRAGLGFGFSALFGFVLSLGIGKTGANINYCLDWQLALCPLAGIFILLAGRKWEWAQEGAFLRPMLVLALGVTGLQLGLTSLKDCSTTLGLTNMTRELRSRERQEQADLVKLIATSFPGPVVSENMTILLRAGKSIPFEPAIIKELTATGMFDEHSLLDKTSRQYFDAFILLSPSRTPAGQSRFSPRMMEAIHQHYAPYPFNGDYYMVYVRKT
jgi:hypothetical protein